MAELLKNIYNDEFFSRFLPCLKQVAPECNTMALLSSIYDEEWENWELKQRMRHITRQLQKNLGNDYERNIKTLLELIPVLRYNNFEDDILPFIFLPDFIELFGQDHYDLSIKAIEEVGPTGSAEGDGKAAGCHIGMDGEVRHAGRRCGGGGE